MLIHSRGNQYNDDPRARESVHLDANDVAPICPVISLHSRGNQYNDAFRLSNCFALLARVAHAGINAPPMTLLCSRESRRMHAGISTPLVTLLRRPNGFKKPFICQIISL